MRKLTGGFFVFCILLQGVSAALPPGQEPAIASTSKSADHDLSSIGEAVVRLLETRDPQKFGRQITPSIDDWRSFLRTNNAPTPVVPPGSGDNKAHEISSRLMASNAQGLLAKVTALGLPRMTETNQPDQSMSGS